MFYSCLKTSLARFRDDTRGTITIESVIVLPLLFWALAASWEFFEVHRFSSIREKAVYTIADMISRETASVNAVYMDNAKTLFDEMANDDAVNQIRVSIVKFDADTNSYSISWSEVRGIGEMSALVTSDVAAAHDTLPIMSDGGELIVVDSRSTYVPDFTVGLSDTIQVSRRAFTSIRFLPQIYWDAG